MTATLQDIEPAEPDPVADAIAALTAAARQTRVRGAGTDQATVEPVDFADLAAHVLTTVAANVGSVETLLAGRSGSWEADLVRRLVDRTASEDELLRWRTEPVRLHFDAEDTFYTFGISDLLDQERDAIGDVVSRLDGEIQARDEAAERTPADTAVDEQFAAAEALDDAIERLWEQDRAAYAAAYRATVERYLTERGATCGVDIITPVAYASTTWDPLAEQIHEYARQHTQLPMTGSAPDWSDGNPADALRRAGLTYTDRAGGER
ncbi:hypothetical protein ACFFX1_10915 [Dactylosporangium sucinum]|uniref:Uncharacterized protein n=1 Tax=Dactylosporangium sucinum TaxID=1424081 RepID=A0A917WQB0_9ACTN|nr:hypothetical protein [Dactylosporangium sucinum]GGM22780.1 hypothetical protein GCM10007977_024970 [Dactylosporangium sucinum]